MKKLKHPQNLKLDVARLIKEAKGFFFILRTDKEAQIQIRTMGLGIVVCLAFYYCISTLFIQPAEKQLTKKLAQINEFKSVVPEQMNTALATAVSALDIEKTRLDDQLAQLNFKKSMLQEHWRKMGEEAQFSRVIFTLLPMAPVNMEKALSQASMVESRTLQGFDMHPVTLTGKTSFGDFHAYLSYLESRPEVGEISKLSLDALPTGRYDQKADVRFSLTVSRLTLKEEKP